MQETFKLRKTSDKGHSGVSCCQRPRKEGDKTESHCELLRHPNEATVLLGGQKCSALIDTGSMITSISEDFYREKLQATPPLLDIDSSLEIEGAGGHELSFLGVIELEFECPSTSMDELIVPVLVMPSTTYNQRVPAIIGTNVLKRIKSLPLPLGALQDSIVHISSVKGQEEVALYSCGYVTLPAHQTTVISIFQYTA